MKLKEGGFGLSVRRQNTCERNKLLVNTISIALTVLTVGASSAANHNARYVIAAYICCVGFVLVCVVVISHSHNHKTQTD